jgi:hypothetical protein
MRVLHVATDCRVRLFTDQGGAKWNRLSSRCARTATNARKSKLLIQGERIGEDANTVRLSHAEWNELVALVKRGELHEI